MYLLKKECSTAHGKVTLTNTEYENLAESLKQYYRKMTPEQMDRRNEQSFIEMNDSREEARYFDED